MRLLQLRLDDFEVNSQFSLKDIDIDLSTGFCTAILGKSGCGKSTLLKLLAGFEKRAANRLWMRGKKSLEFSTHEWREFYRKVAFIEQNYIDSLSPKLTAWDILTEPLKLFKLPIDKMRIVELLESVGLSEQFLNRTPDEMSGGQNQRLLIARALLLEPEALLCDEITSGLDLPQKVSIAKLLSRLKRERQIAIAFVTHEVLLLPFLADEVITMENGKIAERTSIANLFTNIQSEETKILLEASML